MKHILKRIFISAIALVLSACVTTQTNSKRTGVLGLSSTSYAPAYITSSRYQPELTYTYKNTNCTQSNAHTSVYTPAQHTRDSFTYQPYRRCP